MTRTRFRQLALMTLLTSSFALTAVAAENVGTTTPENKMSQHLDKKEWGKKRLKPEERFKQDDTNNDGFLTKDEMLAAHQKRIDEIYERLDTNKDGKLSPEEMKKGRDEMRQKMKERREKMGKMHHEDRDHGDENPTDNMTH